MEGGSSTGDESSISRGSIRESVSIHGNKEHLFPQR